MSDQRDWAKYRTLTDKEIRDELKKNREIKENMYTLTGKIKNGRYVNNATTGTKFVAPQFGTQTRAKKIEKRNWEADLNTMRSSGEGKFGSGTGAGTLRSTGEYHNTMSRLVENSVRNHPEEYAPHEYEEEKEEAVTRTAFRSASGGLQVPQQAEMRMQRAVETIKSKYDQNLHVVEQLFDEKQEMEHKIRLLEVGRHNGVCFIVCTKNVYDGYILLFYYTLPVYYS
jgi:hypothetical protein